MNMTFVKGKDESHIPVVLMPVTIFDAEGAVY
jgi:hypothetical protein